MRFRCKWNPSPTAGHKKAARRRLFESSITWAKRYCDAAWLDSAGAAAVATVFFWEK
jgi:hypothetical protein